MSTTTPSNEKPVPPVALPVDLRDYFAARFLAGFWSNSEALKQLPHGDEAALIAKMAYDQADAMLKERAK